jgi:hypothetical protein
VDAADTPAVSGDGKVENGILLFAVKVMAWTTTASATSSNTERRPELVRPSARSSRGQAPRFTAAKKIREGLRWCAQTRGSRRDQKGGGRVTYARRKWLRRTAVLYHNGEEIGQPGGTIWRGKTGQMEREARTIYRSEVEANGAGKRRRWWQSSLAQGSFARCPLVMNLDGFQY